MSIVFAKNHVKLFSLDLGPTVTLKFRHPLLMASTGCNITLGVTLCHNFCMSKHIDTVITSCACTLYGLRTLRAHGMPQASLQLIFRTTAIAKLLYAAPAWWGFANFGDMNRLEAFLRRASKSDYYTGDFTIAAL